MYKSMLVPLDGSKLAEVVFTYARELAGRLGMDMVLLHVYSPEVPGPFLERPSIEITADIAKCRAYVERMADIMTRESRDIQERAGIKPGAKQVEARGEVAIGNAAEEILRYAEEKKMDLILMATHGYSGIRRWAIGSVADKVLRVSQVPIWLVRANIPQEIVYDQWPTRKILVPLDGSELAESALPHAEVVAKQRGAELVEVVLLRVCQSSDLMFESPLSYYLIPDSYPPTRPLQWQKYLEEETTKCKLVVKRYLDGVAKRLTDASLRVRSQVLVGKTPLASNAADEILDYATTNQINLIVMATHGRSGLSRWAYGSVAARILYGGNTPILLVRPH